MELAEELNVRGFLTRNGSRWTCANLHQRLRGSTFLGQAVFRRSDQQWGGHCTKLGSDGLPLYGASVVIPLPPILSTDRIKSFQEALARLTRPGRKPNLVYPLTGRIQGVCGLPYVGSFRGKDGIRTYRCSALGKPGSCGCVFLRADYVEREVEERINALLASTPPDVRSALPSAGQASATLIRHLERVRSLDRLAARYRQELDALRSRGEQGLIAEAATRQLESDVEVVGRILAHARDWLRELENEGNRDNRLRTVLASPAPDIRTLSPSEKRRIIELVEVRVEMMDPAFRYREGTRCLTTEWHLRTGTPVPPDPTDCQWARIEELLRSRYPAHHFRSRLNLRAACAGMLHRLRTGILWRDLPEQFGDSRKVRCRQRTWLADGVWADIVKLLGDAWESTPVLSYEAAPAMVIRTDLDAEVLR